MLACRPKNRIKIKRIYTKSLVLCYLLYFELHIKEIILGYVMQINKYIFKKAYVLKSILTFPRQT